MYSPLEQFFIFVVYPLNVWLFDLSITSVSLTFIFIVVNFCFLVFTFISIFNFKLMKKISHPFHLVNSSPWPFLMGIAAVNTAIALVSYMHQFESSFICIFFVFINTFLVLFYFSKNKIVFSYFFVFFCFFLFFFVFFCEPVFAEETKKIIESLSEPVNEKVTSEPDPYKRTNEQKFVLIFRATMVAFLVLGFWLQSKNIGGGNPPGFPPGGNPPGFPPGGNPPGFPPGGNPPDGIGGIPASYAEDVASSALEYSLSILSFFGAGIYWIGSGSAFFQDDESSSSDDESSSSDDESSSSDDENSQSGPHKPGKEEEEEEEEKEKEKKDDSQSGPHKPGKEEEDDEEVIQDFVFSESSEARTLDATPGSLNVSDSTVQSSSLNFTFLENTPELPIPIHELLQGFEAFVDQFSIFLSHFPPTIYPMVFQTLVQHVVVWLPYISFSPQLLTYPDRRSIQFFIALPYELFNSWLSPVSPIYLSLVNNGQRFNALIRLLRNLPSSNGRDLYRNFFSINNSGGLFKKIKMYQVYFALTNFVDLTYQSFFTMMTEIFALLETHYSEYSDFLKEVLRITGGFKPGIKDRQVILRRLSMIDIFLKALKRYKYVFVNVKNYLETKYPDFCKVNKIPTVIKKFF